MNVSGKTKIYRKDFDGRPSYTRSVCSQEFKDGKKGDWISTYEPVQFPKGTDIPDRSIVEVKGFEAVYKGKDDQIKRKLVVQEYRVLDAGSEEPKGFSKLSDSDIPF